MEVCENCFNDYELKSFISVNSTTKKDCSHCDSKDSNVVDFEELHDFFFEFINIFVPDEEGVLLKDIIKLDWKLFSDEFDNDNIISEILSGINNTSLSISKPVKYKDSINKSLKFWNELKDKIKWESRFLTNVSEIKELKWDYFFEQAKIELALNQEFYRSRIYTNGQIESFDKSDMGHPPKEMVSEGRANPQGIPYLYLSQSLETTLYETRATYLDEVTVGKFTVVEESEKLVLVDFTSVSSAFSIMSDYNGNIEDSTSSVLLTKQISKELSKPLRRHDSVIEYIPTQFICEYIRYITGADGIMFESSLHKGGVNIVLFDKSKVECTSVETVKISEILIKSSSEDYELQ